MRGGHAANHALLSGVLSTERAGYPDGNLSIDQRAAELVGHNTRYPSLVFWRQGMSFTRTGVRVPAVVNPATRSGSCLRMTRRTKEVRPRRPWFEWRILDAVLSDAKGLKHQLGTEDRHKLEEYFTSIRETERNWS